MVADLKAQHQEATLRSERLRQEAEVLAESLRIAEQVKRSLSVILIAAHSYWTK